MCAGVTPQVGSIILHNCLKSYSVADLWYSAVLVLLGWFDSNQICVHMLLFALTDIAHLECCHFKIFWARNENHRRRKIRTDWQLSDTYLYTARSPSCAHGRQCRTLPEVGQVWLRCPAEPELRSAAGTSCWCWLCRRILAQSLDFQAWSCWSRRPCRLQRARSHRPRTRTDESGTPAGLRAVPPVPWQSHHSQSVGVGAPWLRSSWRTVWGPDCRFQSCWQWRPHRHSGGWSASPEWSERLPGKERPREGARASVYHSQPTVYTLGSIRSK